MVERRGREQASILSRTEISKESLRLIGRIKSILRDDPYFIAGLSNNYFGEKDFDAQYRRGPSTVSFNDPQGDGLYELDFKSGLDYMHARIEHRVEEDGSPYLKETLSISYYSGGPHISYSKIETAEEHFTTLRDSRQAVKAVEDFLSRFKSS